MREKKPFLASCLLILSFCVMPVYAHSGGTDGQGGHYNRSTGEYHFHHGYSAHDHYDMNGDGIADCPYEFESNTASQPNTITSNISYKEWHKKGYDAGYAAGEKAGKEDTDNKILEAESKAKNKAYTISFVAGVLIIFFLNNRSSKRETALHNEIVSLKEELQTVKRNSNYHSVSPSSPLPPVSPSFSTTRTVSSRRPFGENTVYISKSGTKYHCKYRCSNAVTPVNIEELPKGYTACRNCVPKNK